MVRVAAWTGVLFGIGLTISHLFPTSWIEPVVLLGLGATMLVVSSRLGQPRTATSRAVGRVAPRTAIAAATAKEAPAA